MPLATPLENVSVRTQRKSAMVVPAGAANVSRATAPSATRAPALTDRPRPMYVFAVAQVASLPIPAAVGAAPKMPFSKTPLGPVQNTTR